MASSHGLKGICRSLAEAFVSRNNDLDGYWALGLLRSEAERIGIRSCRIDLLTAEASLNGPVSAALARRYSAVLVHLPERTEIPLSRVSYASFEVHFGGFGSCPPPPWRRRGDPFWVLAKLTSHTGMRYEHCVSGYCSPHDPDTEGRSNRAERSNNSSKPTPLRGAA
jgi:hypothetical protein